MRATLSDARGKRQSKIGEVCAAAKRLRAGRDERGQFAADEMHHGFDREFNRENRFGDQSLPPAKMLLA
jgi:hypothetical protein